MRRLALPLALAMLTTGTLPVLADGALPGIATLRLGPFAATVRNDSPTLITGVNTLTVEIPMLASDGHVVSLSLEGPRGERLDVPLRQVRVLGGPADEHAGHADAHTASTALPASGYGAPAPATHAYMPGMSHDMPGMIHEPAPPPDAPLVGDHAAAHADDGPTYVARGSVSVPEAGDWQARLVVSQVRGERFVAEALLVAEDGGPNHWYLAGAGSLISGFLLFGAVQRRRQPLAVLPRKHPR